MGKTIQDDARNEQKNSSGSPNLSTAFFKVSPSRLASGNWCQQSNRQIGTGDIHAAYSADLIGQSSKIRRPFHLQGSLCVTVGCAHHHGETTAEAYRLTRIDAFEGTPTSYSEKPHGDARKDPMGFYHGMTVSHGGKTYVLTGPPMLMVPGAPTPSQGTLF